jgi:hypothetical protein
MKILLTNNHMQNIGGSELVTLELAELYKSLGHDVLIYSPNIHPSNGLDINHIEHTEEMPHIDKFDLLWIHHSVGVPTRKLSHQRIVFNHMSSYVPLEWPKCVEKEQSLADFILANSIETACVLARRGLRKIKLFQNPAPKNFEIKDRNPIEPLAISNHPPSELPPFPRRHERITPYHMARASFVVANGKSVQYALRAEVPVYLYDHFGGPGWLTKENFHRAEYYNFSGRGFQRKTREIIESEIRHIPAPLKCPDRFKLEHSYALKALE